ncbi:HIT family protein [Nocardia sp. N2S4-5]|uniref:HIT family protein n=1 Tax=Nocardia sp. N2S4-5 TaxID=3351565 RepID=UPI0037D53410
MSRSDRAVQPGSAGPRQLLLPLDYPNEPVQSAYIDGCNGSSHPDPSCIFCRHADPTVNTVVRSRGTMYARWDNFPASRGHVEIVPFRHILSFFDMTTRETRDMHVLARSVKDTLDSLYKPDGFTIGVNDGSAAGRTVPHLHIHIIPRWHGDVPDPRGGIRNVFADCDPDAWS